MNPPFKIGDGFNEFIIRIVVFFYSRLLLRGICLYGEHLQCDTRTSQSCLLVLQVNIWSKSC